MNQSTAGDAEARRSDGPVHLYEAKADFEYDPDLLVNSVNVISCIYVFSSLYQEINHPRTQNLTDWVIWLDYPMITYR